MRTILGAGCWPGRAEGRVVPYGAEPQVDRTPVNDRAGQILHFRTEVARALQDLEHWSERQLTLSARLALHAQKEALLEDAWVRRVCSLIDTEGLPAAVAACEAAVQVRDLLARSESLRERAWQLLPAARWIVRRLTPVPMPEDAVLAITSDLTPGELLDLPRPALLAGAEPPVTGWIPLVWGLPGLGPDWTGRRVALDGAAVTLDVPEPVVPVDAPPLCDLAGDLDPVGLLTEAAAAGGGKPAALVRRLDDLAAIPVWVHLTSTVVVDLDRMGRVSSLRHPGAELLLRVAADAARRAGVPFLAGGRAAAAHSDHWLSLGFTGLHRSTVEPPGGRQSNAI